MTQHTQLLGKYFCVVNNNARMRLKRNSINPNELGGLLTGNYTVTHALLSSKLILIGL